MNGVNLQVRNAMGRSKPPTATLSADDISKGGTREERHRIKTSDPAWGGETFYKTSYSQGFSNPSVDRK